MYNKSFLFIALVLFATGCDNATSSHTQELQMELANRAQSHFERQPNMQDAAECKKMCCKAGLYVDRFDEKGCKCITVTVTKRKATSDSNHIEHVAIDHNLIIAFDKLCKGEEGLDE